MAGCHAGALPSPVSKVNNKAGMIRLVKLDNSTKPSGSAAADFLALATSIIGLARIQTVSLL
jgi:hypothetical protein